MNIQEREEADYEVGCFQNELQAVFALGQSERSPSDRSKIADVIAAGLFAVYSEYPSFCPYTDACNGTIQVLHDFGFTEEEATVKARALQAEIGYDTEEGVCVRGYTPLATVIPSAARIAQDLLVPF